MNDDRSDIVMGLAQGASDACKDETGRAWDLGPLSLARDLRTFLLTICDEGKGVDSGGGDGLADLHPWIGGREYHIRIEPSRAQKAHEAN